MLRRGWCYAFYGVFGDVRGFGVGDLDVPGVIAHMVDDEAWNSEVAHLETWLWQVFGTDERKLRSKAMEKGIGMHSSNVLLIWSHNSYIETKHARWCGHWAALYPGPLFSVTTAWELKHRFLQVYFLFRYCSGVVELTYFIAPPKKKAQKASEDEHLKDKDLDGTKNNYIMFHVFFPSSVHGSLFFQGNLGEEDFRLWDCWDQAQVLLNEIPVGVQPVQYLFTEQEWDLWHTPWWK